jgi:hypothetical protein
MNRRRAVTSPAKIEEKADGSAFPNSDADDQPPRTAPLMVLTLCVIMSM